MNSVQSIQEKRSTFIQPRRIPTVLTKHVAPERLRDVRYLHVDIPKENVAAISSEKCIELLEAMNVSVSPIAKRIIHTETFWRQHTQAGTRTCAIVNPEVLGYNVRAKTSVLLQFFERENVLCPGFAAFCLRVQHSTQLPRYGFSIAMLPVERHVLCISCDVNGVLHLNARECTEESYEGKKAAWAILL